MAGSESLRSVKAAVAAAASLWGLYLVAVAVATLARGRGAAQLGAGAWLFGAHALVFLVLLLLFLVPLLQLATLRKRGAAVSAPIAALLALATILMTSLYLADPGDGDPATVAGFFSHWSGRPLEFLAGFVPYWVAVAVFPWARRRLGRS